MTPPRITEAKAIAECIGADAVVVLAFKGDTVAGASYGRTKAICRATGKWMDELIDDLGDGNAASPKISAQYLYNECGAFRRKP